MSMDLGEPWEPQDGSRRDELLARYHQRHGGLLFVDPNVAQAGSRPRFPSGILITNPSPENDEDAYDYRLKDSASVQERVSKLSAELIEVQNWGFNGFGRIVGKSRIIEREWNPHRLKRVLVVKNSDDKDHPYYPEKKRDPSTEAVFDDSDIEIVVMD
jgi:hypothetical protein